MKAGAAAGAPVGLEVKPEGSALEVENRLVTIAETGNGVLTMERLPGSQRLAAEVFRRQVELLWRRHVVDYLLLSARRP